MWMKSLATDMKLDTMKRGGIPIQQEVEKDVVRYLERGHWDRGGEGGTNKLIERYRIYIYCKQATTTRCNYEFESNFAHAFLPKARNRRSVLSQQRQ